MLESFTASKPTIDASSASMLFSKMMLAKRISIKSTSLR